MKATKPNLPENDIKKLIVSKKLSYESVSWFEKKGVELIFAPLLPMADTRLRHHVDLGICHVAKNTLVLCPSVYPYFNNSGIDIIQGRKEPGPGYPDDAAYNVCIIGNLAMHNFRHTDPVLLEFLSTRYDLIDVKQTYAKCAVAVISEKYVITQDKGIAKAFEKKGVEALFINEEKLRLDGFPYGFIGGASLMGNKYTWLVNGLLNKLDSWYNITQELGKREVDIKSMNEYQPTDVGSFIVLYEEEDFDEKND